MPSALAQTVTELEVLVVGDGVPDETRELMAELAAADERVRFFDNPKGERHGEAHRDAALREARGEIVCYLSDDDLWLPGHVEHLGELLAEADVASALSFLVATDASLHVSRTDLGRPYYRSLLERGENRTHLSVLGHTLACYRSLPGGWTATPAGIATDLYFLRRLLAQPGCAARAVTGPRSGTSRARCEVAGAVRSGSPSSTTGARDGHSPHARSALRAVGAASVDCEAT